MKTALVVGNGLTKSLLQHLGLNINPSNPLDWALHLPGSNSLLLIDYLPYLKEYISKSKQSGVTNSYAIFQNLVSKSLECSNASPIPSRNDEEQQAILDANHFLALAYSWLQTELDKHSLSEWEWANWVSTTDDHLIGVLSWNYDLVIERLINFTETPYFYTPAISTPSNFFRVKVNRSAIPISKPHGSCNFSPRLNLSTSVDGITYEPLTYPRALLATGYDGELNVLENDKLYSARQIVDLVLPGEWNRFNPHLKWTTSMIQFFSCVAQKAEQLVVIGFSMMDCDREEFIRAIGKNDFYKRIVIVDPKPSDKLIAQLKNKTNDLQIKTIGTPE